eukprot:80460_1
MGPAGREAEVGLNLSKEGVSSTYAYTFSKGIFGGVSLESAMLNVRAKENERFYGESAKAKETLWEDAVGSPQGKGIEELHHKLDLLRDGKVLVPTPAYLQRKDSLRIEAEQAGAAAKASQTDVIKVEAKEQADKEREGLL